MTDSFLKGVVAGAGAAALAALAYKRFGAAAGAPAKGADARDDSWSDPGVKVDTVGVPGGGKRVVLVARPQKEIKDTDLQVVEEPIPEPGPGQAVVQNLLISIDPTHRIWMSEASQYMPSVGLGTVMRAICISKVVKTSDAAAAPVGSVWSCFGAMQEYALLPIAGGLSPIVPDVPLSYNLSIFSVVIGLTAWLGANICAPKAGETMVVSGAAGAVGSVAAQLGKARGARVIGIAGGAEKCAWLASLGLDGVIDYKRDDVAKKLGELAPEGVDSYFDNVGGPTLETALTSMRNFGRIAYCGSISGYNQGEDVTMTVKNYEMILMRRLTVQGFVCPDHLSELGAAFAELIPLVSSGKIQIKEDVREVSIDKYTSVVRALYSGANKGKLMMKIA